MSGNEVTIELVTKISSVACAMRSHEKTQRSNKIEKTFLEYLAISSTRPSSLKSSMPEGSEQHGRDLCPPTGTELVLWRLINQHFVIRPAKDSLGKVRIFKLTPAGINSFQDRQTELSPFEICSFKHRFLKVGFN